MSRNNGGPRPTRAIVLLLSASWLVLLGLPWGSESPGPVRSAAAQYPPQVPDGQDFPVFPDPFGQPPGDDSDAPRPSRATRAKAARKKARAAEKGKTSTKKTDAKAQPQARTKDQDKETGKAAPPESKPAEAGPLKFATDIAPILVANCAGCHKPGGRGVTKGKLDLTTFEKLQKGTPEHKIVLAGKPEESALVLRIKGEATPRMPLGNNRALSAQAIARIEQWVKSGASLDSGLDPKTAMSTYAASPDQMRRNQLARLSTSERDQQVEAVGRERWKQANPKLQPEVVAGEHFLFFGNLPRDRVTSTLKSLEPSYAHLKRLLGASAMDWAEKVSLYVFSSPNDFVEFVRTVEGREADPEVHSSARLGIPQPYVAVVDPAGGKREDPAARRRAKGKRSEEGGGASTERSLLGVLTESFGSGTVGAAGNAPRWIREGIGLYMAAQVEPRSPYYRQLRVQAFQNFDQGWQTKATETLGEGNQITAADLHAVSFALVEAMMSTNLREGFQPFLHGLLEGQAKLDDTLEGVYGGNREQFLNLTGEWVAANYGQLQ